MELPAMRLLTALLTVGSRSTKLLPPFIIWKNSVKCGWLDWNALQVFSFSPSSLAIKSRFTTLPVMTSVTGVCGNGDMTYLAASINTKQESL